jgi:hypothetical protein
VPPAAGTVAAPVRVAAVSADIAARTSFFMVGLFSWTGRARLGYGYPC